MNTYLQLLKSSAPIYKKIESTPALKWLDQNYNIGGKLPVKEYYSMRSTVHWLRLLETLMTLFLVIGTAFIAKMTMTLIPESDAALGGIRGLELFLMVAIGKLFWHWWEKMLNAYIGHEWQTKGFLEDTQTVLEAVGSTLDLVRDIKLLSGNGTEGNRVPRHVVEMSEKKLVWFALNIRQGGLSQAIVPTWKGNLNSSHSVFTKRFRILPEKYEVSEAYDAAEKQIEQERAKEAGRTKSA